MNPRYERPGLHMRNATFFGHMAAAASYHGTRGIRGLLIPASPALMASAQPYKLVAQITTVLVLDTSTAVPDGIPPFLIPSYYVQAQ